MKWPPLVLTGETTHERALDLARQMHQGKVYVSPSQPDHLEAINSCLPIHVTNFLSVSANEKGLVVVAQLNGRPLCLWAHTGANDQIRHGYQFLDNPPFDTKQTLSRFQVIRARVKSYLINLWLAVLGRTRGD